MEKNIEMSLVEKLRQKQKSYLALTDVPQSIEVKMIKAELKGDKTGSESLFIELITKDDRYVTQKYTVTSYEDIANAIEQAGGEELLKTDFHSWTKRLAGRMQNPRLFPDSKE